MIRSRDLVIFVGVVLFLVFGITLTHLKAVYAPLFAGTPVAFLVDTNASTSFTAIAQLKTDTDKRASTIERLKKALAQNTEVIQVNPSVETAVVATSTETNGDQDVATSVEGNAGIVSCGSSDDSFEVMSQWPRSDVRIEIKAGMRLIVHTEEKEAPILFATSTVSSSVQVKKEQVVTTLLQIEMYPRVQSNPTCVPSTIIGVTSLGALLSNSDASFYKNTNSNVLIGYARDGFPVYGLFEGAVDACGGYVHPEGYRYTIGKDRNYVLGCFVGIPQSFNL